MKKLILLSLLALVPGMTSAQTTQPREEPKVQIVEEVIGTGRLAEVKNTVTVHYVGTLLDGTKFDSSVDRNEPFVFTAGVGQVIKGFDQGTLGMRVGGKRKVTFPPELGYGNREVGPIPANSTLIFEIELLNVQ